MEDSTCNSRQEEQMKRAETLWAYNAKNTDNQKKRCLSSYSARDKDSIIALKPVSPDLFADREEQGSKTVVVGGSKTKRSFTPAEKMMMLS